MSSAVTKAMFARLCKVTPSCVWGWVNDGKIDGAAISGTGRGMRIDVDLALQQLRERRAVDESFGLNGIATDLDGDGGTVADLIKLEKLKQMRLITAEKEAEAEALAADTVTRLEANTMARQGVEAMVRLVESVLRDVATAISVNPERNPRLILHSMLEGPDGFKAGWRRWYAARWPAEAAAQSAEVE